MPGMHSMLSDGSGYRLQLVLPLSSLSSFVTAQHSPAMQETWVPSLSQEDPLGKDMAIHSSSLAWETPWRKEPGGLQSLRSQTAGHDGVTNTFTSLSALSNTLPTFQEFSML